MKFTLTVLGSLLFYYLAYSNAYRFYDHRLKPGLKSIRILCDRENEIKKIKVFVKMNGNDSVFKEFQIQMRNNSNFAYGCSRGYFKNPLTSCQVINCDGKTIGTLLYSRSASTPGVDSLNHIDIY